MIGMVASIGWPFSPWHEPQTCNFASTASAAAAGAPSAATMTSVPKKVERWLLSMFPPGVVRVPAVPLTRSTRWNQPKTCRSQACDASRLGPLGLSCTWEPTQFSPPPLAPASGGGEKKASLQLPHLSGPQRAEALRRNFGSPQGLGEREERGIERLVGQLEGAVMVGERDFGAAIDQRLHGLGWVHVLVAHEPARLVGSDRQNSQSDRSVALARSAEM